jgi:UDP-glucose 4-epimerase
MAQKILITGGCGYIGSHTIVDLIENGYEVFSVDSLINSDEVVLDGVFKITGVKVENLRLDLSQDNAVQELTKKVGVVDGIIHFAALKAVGESVDYSLLYYSNNVKSLINILQYVDLHNIKAFVFSSSCTVYGNSEVLPVNEDLEFKKTNSPYGRTKQMCEEIIADYYNKVNSNSQAISLRYFNPAGAHSSYLIGESPINHAMNLVPVITETAIGIRSEFYVHGTDYPTRDGSCVRDYIHVMDLAHAHSLALNHLLSKQQAYSLEAYNLGIGEGVSVIEAIKAFESVNQIKLNYKLGPRREGDLAAIYANNSKIVKDLNWYPKKNIDDIMKDAWAWEKMRRK